MCKLAVRVRGARLYSEVATAEEMSRSAKEKTIKVRPRRGRGLQRTRHSSDIVAGLGEDGLEHRTRRWSLYLSDSDRVCDTGKLERKWAVWNWKEDRSFSQARTNTSRR